MMVSPLNRKLARDVWHLRGQLLTIALVVAAGVMTVVTLHGTYVSLATALDAFYRDYRFADVFADLSRAPEPLTRTIERIPGVAHVETRVKQVVNLDVAGLDEPAVGLLLSIPPEPESTLNSIHIVSGRYIDAGRPDEVLVSESFARANGLVAGSTVGAVINGRRRTLEIVGIAISPDYIGEVAPGTVFPDDRRFGILRMGRPALAAAAGLEDSFNELSVALDPTAGDEAVVAEVDRILAPYGGLGAYGRTRHPSHQAVMGELEQNRVTGTIIPAIFLAVAAFLLNIVLSRLVGTQREQIAALKAFGYGNRTIGGHYLLFALVAVLAGALGGTVTGIWFGDGLTRMYGEYFRFPDLQYEAAWGVIVFAVGVSVAAASLGALGAVRRAVRLPPAEAMRPEAPMRYRPGPIERFGPGRWLSAAGRMIVRNVERQPRRSLMSALGVALSVAILVVSMFFFDAVRFMIDVQFRETQRESLALHFTAERQPTVRYDLARLDGVTAVEVFRTVPVRLSAGHVQRSIALVGVQPDAALRRVVDQNRGPVRVPRDGVLLNSKLAEILRVRVGDVVDVHVLDGRRVTRSVVVTGTVDEMFGINAYMDFDALHELLAEAAAVSGAYLRADDAMLPDLHRRVKRLPAVLSASSPAALRASFEEQMDENLMVSVTFLVVLAAILTVGIIYNGARIALSERGRELASLRVLGFTRREVSALLLGEQAAITLTAIPLGWVLGFGLGVFILSLLDMESYRVPLVITERTYIYSALIALVAAAVAALAVRRRLDRLDLIRVLKTRE